MDRIAGGGAVALLPVGRWGPHRGPDRLTPVSAVEAMRRVGARAAVPIHWGTLHPPGMPPGRRGSPAAGAGGRFAAPGGAVGVGAGFPGVRPGRAPRLRLPRVDPPTAAPPPPH